MKKLLVGIFILLGLIVAGGVAAGNKTAIKLFVLGFGVGSSGPSATAIVNPAGIAILNPGGQEITTP